MRRRRWCWRWGWGWDARWLRSAGLRLGLLAAGFIAESTYFFARRLRREKEVVMRAVRRMPEYEAPGDGGAGEAEDLLYAVRQVSDGLRSRLLEADLGREALASVLDSMQDAVVAVDAGGRIQWTNGPLERLVPGTPGSSVRVGQAMVQIDSRSGSAGVRGVGAGGERSLCAAVDDDGGGADF